MFYDPSTWNAGQWFMFLQILACLGGGIGFMIGGKWWGGLVWVMYSVANVGWFMIAGGKQ